MLVDRKRRISVCKMWNIGAFYFSQCYPFHSVCVWEDNHFMERFVHRRWEVYEVYL